MRSPFAKGRRQKSPSFSIFRRNGAWGWCDRTGGQEIKGDEIDFIEQYDKISRSEAIHRYLEMAGVVEVAISGKQSWSPAELAEARAADSPPDWAACVAKFTDDHVARLVESRGYSLEFVRWLRDQSLVGIRKDGIAFPVHRSDGALVAVAYSPAVWALVLPPARGRMSSRSSLVTHNVPSKRWSSKVSGMRLP